MENEITYTKGMILTSTWGYGQTNVSWYKVVKVTKSGKTLILQEIDSKFNADKSGHMCGHELPLPTKKKGQPFRKLIKRYMSPKQFMGSFQVWDGTPQFTSYWN